MDLKVTRGNVAKCRAVPRRPTRQSAGRWTSCINCSALLFLGADEFRATREQRQVRLRMFAEQRVLEPFHSLSLVPSESANVCKVKQIQDFGRCICFAKRRHLRRVVHVGRWRCSHSEGDVNEQLSVCRIRFIETQRRANTRGEVRARGWRDRGLWSALPVVVQQQRE